MPAYRWMKWTAHDEIAGIFSFLLPFLPGYAKLKSGFKKAVKGGAPWRRAALFIDDNVRLKPDCEGARVPWLRGCH